MSLAYLDEDYIGMWCNEKLVKVDLPGTVDVVVMDADVVVKGQQQASVYKSCTLMNGRRIKVKRQQWFFATNETSSGERCVLFCFGFLLHAGAAICRQRRNDSHQIAERRVSFESSMNANVFKLKSKK